jgi:hypothetical protein
MSILSDTSAAQRYPEWSLNEIRALKGNLCVEGCSANFDCCDLLLLSPSTIVVKIESERWSQTCRSS